jgi:uncharacterized membrane protein YpjA
VPIKFQHKSRRHLRAAFVVVTLVSLGLWAVIWLVIFSLA